MSNSGEAFLKAIEQDPTLLNRLKKQAELADFKEKYNTQRATHLKCPVCAQFYQYPGSLWINKDDHTKFVCKKCKLEYNLECLTVPNDKLIEDLRKATKGKLTSISWFEPKKEEEGDPGGKIPSSHSIKGQPGEGMGSYDDGSMGGYVDRAF